MHGEERGLFPLLLVPPLTPSSTIQSVAWGILEMNEAGVALPFLPSSTLQDPPADHTLPVHHSLALSPPVSHTTSLIHSFNKYPLSLYLVLRSVLWTKDPAKKDLALKERVCMCMLGCFSCAQLFATHQAPPSMGFSRYECWRGFPVPSTRGSFWSRNQTLVSCVSCIGRSVLYHQGHLRSPH